MKSRSKDRLTDFRALTPVKQGGTTSVNLAMVSGNRPFGIAFTGYFHAVQAGEYTFTLDSDTGAMLFLHDIRVIDEPMKNAAGKFSGTVRLQAGWHPLRLYYRHADSGQPHLELTYEIEGATSLKLDASNLRQPVTAPK